MPFKSPFASFFKKILFPEGITCPVCGKETEKEGLCKVCRGKMPLIHNGCNKCGCGVYSGSYCVRCKAAHFDFERNYAAADYSNFVKNIIYRFKNGDRYLFKPLAELTAQTLKENGAQFDIILSVPVTEKVLKKRGYNQSRLIAEHIALLTGKEYIDALIKVKETPFQKNCPAAERRKNVEKAFKVTDKGIVTGKRVLIADDIITTGSTLSECALTLKKAGAAETICCTFAAVAHKIKYDSLSP